MALFLFLSLVSDFSDCSFLSISLSILTRQTCCSTRRQTNSDDWQCPHPLDEWRRHAPWCPHPHAPCAHSLGFSIFEGLHLNTSTFLPSPPEAMNESQSVNNVTSPTSSTTVQHFLCKKVEQTSNQGLGWQKKISSFSFHCWISSLYPRLYVDRTKAFAGFLNIQSYSKERKKAKRYYE